MLKLNTFKTTILAGTFAFGFAAQASANGCQDACTAVEATAQVACVIAIFDEPECSIAVAAAYAACTAACLATNDVSAVEVEGGAPARTKLVSQSILNSDLCNGKLTAAQPEKAAAFCSMFK